MVISLTPSFFKYRQQPKIISFFSISIKFCPFLPSALFSVMCYNVLCDKYATRQLYGYCPSWALNWEYRKKSIMQEIMGCSADIISLQVRDGSQSMCLDFHRKGRGNESNTCIMLCSLINAPFVNQMFHLEFQFCSFWKEMFVLLSCVPVFRDVHPDTRFVDYRK